VPHTKSTETESLFQIPLETAIEWTTRWREFQQTAKPSPADNKKAFRVNLVELQEVVNNIPGEVNYIRFYFGIDDKLGEHMILVGVNDENEDLCSYTYDFTRPCPSTCDLTSPLYSNTPDQ
jgi:hypothetical protein